MNLLSIYLPIYVSRNSPTYPIIHLPTYPLSIHLPTYSQHPLSSHPSFYLPSMHPHIICLSAITIFHLPVHRHTHLSVSPFIYYLHIRHPLWTQTPGYLFILSCIYLSISLLLHPPTDIPHPSTHHLSNFSYFILLSSHLLKSSTHYLLSHPATSPSTYHLCYSITLFQLPWKVAGRGIRENSCFY